MKKNTLLYLAILAAAGFTACEPEFEHNLTDADYSAGEADFTRYVAVGNSLTSGYMDGTVSRIGQTYSFPNQLAQQFKIVGGGEFTQPSYADDVNNLGGIAGLPGFNTRLIIDAGAGGPEPIAGTSTVTLTAQQKAYNNMGVPGAKSFHLLAAGYGNPAGLALGLANPYFVRHATSPTTTVLADALSLNPTFFTNWIGANDVLSYATSGGIGIDQTGNTNPATYGGNDITDPTVFAGTYTEIIRQLTLNGAKGVVATVPNITSIPFFTTVPYNPLTASAIGDGDTTVGLASIRRANAQLYGPLNQILTAFGQPDRIHLLSETDPNPLLIIDESLVNLGPQITAAAAGNPATAPFATVLGQIYGQARQATAQDLILLTTRSVIGEPPPGVPAPFDTFGVAYPLQDQHVLTAAEVTLVNNATTNFNNAIRAIAATKNLAVADMNAILNQLVSGLRTSDGQIYTADYFSTAKVNTVLFSLDGVHPNARGYALVANEVIKVINEHYKAKLPMITAGYYPGATILPSN
ncbi:G-D-S-L family lipolytic protein [Flavobacterium rivuli WB 3.3-2 = DSM 21788]|uniref:G-D-S-L family lipolytic protein n=1 Tax=Flavobacterium rivuli WB 3.3-2 = DSM 21788 TaxID=1121895 RepID=A0A0A2M7A7_9FLAO|nr:SGNH/GDSL hydrolase family protein [Flavobacterium rivuli]KGO87348.1 G-D-S-L family lipolytic protein [Flavobacterium rivuli WB 3.3-2 = DSM 21788]